MILAGKVALVFHSAVYVVAFVGCYTLVKTGVDVSFLHSYLGLSAKVVSLPDSAVIHLPPVGIKLPSEPALIQAAAQEMAEIGSTISSTASSISDSAKVTLEGEVEKISTWFSPQTITELGVAYALLLATGPVR
jgi:hypothetical protein